MKLSNEIYGKLNYIVTFILAFLIGGGNYVTALLNLEILLIFIIYNYLKYKKYIFRQISILVFSVIFFIISVIAPGNAIRQSKFEKSTVFSSVVDSIYAAIQSVDGYINITIVLLLLLIIPFLWNIRIKVRISELLLLVVTLFLLYSSMYTPTFYSGYGMPPERLLNIIFITFIILLFLFEIILVQIAKKIIVIRSSNKLKVNYILILSSLLFLTSTSYLHSYFSIGEITSLETYRVVKSGLAEKFDNFQDKRTEILESKEDEVELEVLKGDFKMLSSHDDLTVDWKLGAMQNYYQKKIIISNNEDNNNV